MDWTHQPRSNVRSVKPAARVRFRDINRDYGLEPGPLLVDEDVSIRKSIRNLLGTPIGTDDVEPGYGSDVPYRIMDPIGKLSAFLIETDTIVALALWMRTRIVILGPGVGVTELDDEDGYLVRIPYQRLKDGGVGEFSFEILR